MDSIKKEYLLKDMKNILKYIDTVDDKITNVISLHSTALVVNGKAFRTGDLKKVKTELDKLKNKIKIDIIPSLEEEVEE